MLNVRGSYDEVAWSGSSRHGVFLVQPTDVSPTLFTVIALRSEGLDNTILAHLLNLAPIDRSCNWYWYWYLELCFLSLQATCKRPHLLLLHAVFGRRYRQVQAYIVSSGTWPYLPYPGPSSIIQHLISFVQNSPTLSAALLHARSSTCRYLYPIPPPSPSSSTILPFCYQSPAPVSSTCSS